MSTVYSKIDIMGEELNHQTREKLNQWIIGKMNAYNLSMRKLGENSGLDQAAISKVLSRKRRAGFEFYLKIARAFDAVPEFLKIAGLLPDEGEEGVTFSELLAVIKELTIEEREKVLSYALFVKREGDGHTSTTAQELDNMGSDKVS